MQVVKVGCSSCCRDKLLKRLLRIISIILSSLLVNPIHFGLFLYFSFLNQKKNKGNGERDALQIEMSTDIGITSEIMNDASFE